MTWQYRGQIVSLALTATVFGAAIMRAGDPTLKQFLQNTGVSGRLCVQLGSGDIEPALVLAERGRLVTHRLDPDAEHVKRLREVVAARGLYGIVSVEHFMGGRLPYVDNLVNLVESDGSIDVSSDEIQRILAPGGIATIRDGDKNRIIRKPVPAGSDEWGHQWHGADGALTSDDTTIGVPTGLQWVSGPLFAMNERKSSTQSFVSKNGRNFYVTQNVVENLGQDEMAQYLIARDAYNGLLLWQRPWTGPFVTGSGEANSRLVAGEDALYIGGEQSVIVVDAATGETIDERALTEPISKLLVAGGRLLVQSDAALQCYDGANLEWDFRDQQVYGTVTDGAQVLCLVGGRSPDGGFENDLVCLDLDSGEQRWRLDTRPWTRTRRLRINFANDGYVALQSHGYLHLFSSSDGAHLWSRTTDALPGKDYADERYVGQFYRHGLVWMRTRTTSELVNLDASEQGATPTAPEAEFGEKDEQLTWLGLDPQTGEVCRRLETSGEWPESANRGKLGCQAMVANSEYIMIPRQAAFVDFQTGQKHLFKFIRGGCGLGFVPANGLVYTTPHACGCYTEVLRGFLAANSTSHDIERDDAARLQRGSAFAADVGGGQAASSTADEDWPMYRHDPQRSGATSTRVPFRPVRIWDTSIIDSSAASPIDEWRLRSGNRISAPVVASGTVFVADVEGQQIVALDETSGQIQWRFTAGGRIDAPPTIHRDLCLFGARDGYVYCVTTDGGELRWRFRAAPVDRRIVAFGRLESVWPVSGTVLVQNDTAYVAAGRTADADGGVHVWALDVRTGTPKWTQHVTELTGLCDYLVASGGKIYLGNQEFDPDTGACRTNDESRHLRGGKAGLLETSWTQVDLALRKSIQDWTVGDASGQLLAFVPQGKGASHEMLSEVFGYSTSEERTGTMFVDGRSPWSREVAAPRQIRACVSAANAFVAAGANDHRDHSRGGFLTILTKESGDASPDLELAAAPIVDGVAVAGERIYVSLQDGTITCVGPPQTASAF